MERREKGDDENLGEDKEGEEGEGEECYRTWLVHEEEDPLLPSVECAVVLTTEGSDRLTKKSGVAFERLKGLCRRTYVQSNRTYGTCRKPGWVSSSCSDLTHAYSTAFRAFDGVVEGVLLVLEDDAQISERATRKDFEEADAFLRTGSYDLYTFGSIGVQVPIGRNHFRFLPRPSFIAFTQAVAWPRKARRDFLSDRSMRSRWAHVDKHFLSKVRNVVTHRKPLIVQTFPVTENSESAWCLVCRRGRLAEAFDVRWRRVTRKFFQFTEMDEKPEAWNGFYALDQLLLPSLLLLVLLVSTTCVASNGASLPSFPTGKRSR